jgi:hypothetical protein
MARCTRLVWAEVEHDVQLVSAMQQMRLTSWLRSPVSGIARGNVRASAAEVTLQDENSLLERPRKFSLKKRGIRDWSGRRRP